MADGIAQVDEQVQETTPATRRRLWVIVLLTVLTRSFAFVYCGQLSRAIRWLLGWWIFCLASTALLFYTPFVRLALALVICCGIGMYLAIIICAWRAEQTLPWKSYQKWWAYLLLFAAFVIVNGCFVDGFRAYVCEAFSIPANSMNDTILAGDRILVDKLFSKSRSYSRQSLVVFRFREDPRKPEINYVKRIVAISGDEVEIRDNQLLVNGETVPEPYAKFDESVPQINRELSKNFFGGRVPEGHVFVLGDNRWQSLDSRRFGFVPNDALIGEAKCVFWSREYQSKPPTREYPQGQEEWGDLRWERVGIPLR